MFVPVFPISSLLIATARGRVLSAIIASRTQKCRPALPLSDVVSICISEGSCHLSTLAKPVDRKWWCTGCVAVGRKTILHEIRYPVLAVVHFNVAIWVLFRLARLLLRVLIRRGRNLQRHPIEDDPRCQGRRPPSPIDNTSRNGDSSEKAHEHPSSQRVGSCSKFRRNSTLAEGCCPGRSTVRHPRRVSPLYRL